MKTIHFEIRVQFPSKDMQKDMYKCSDIMNKMKAALPEDVKIVSTTILTKEVA